VLNIRLARTGRKRDAHFRVVVSDSVHGRVGRIVETLGHYHPRMPNDAEGRLYIKADRARYWLGHGAQPSLTVKSFLKKVLAEPAQSEENPAEEDQTEGNGSGESGSGKSGSNQSG
jgi:small subunit ribosomal protein S16